jgi:hypothetical protein
VDAMFIRFMIAIVVIAITAPFFISGPNGTPIMTLDKLKFSKPSLPGFGGSDETVVTETLYRYQDEQGVWHCTNQVPTDNIAEQIEISTDINLIQAPPTAPTSRTSESNISANPLTAITRGGEIMEDAQAVQEITDDRLDQMDQSLNDIR